MLILFYDLAQCDKWTLTDSLESPKVFVIQRKLRYHKRGIVSYTLWRKGLLGRSGFFLHFSFIQKFAVQIWMKSPSYQKNQVVFHLPPKSIVKRHITCLLHTSKKRNNESTNSVFTWNILQHFKFVKTGFVDW